MSKQSGLGNQLYLGGYDLSGTTGALSKIASPRAVQDVTAIDKSAFERIFLARDGVIDFTSFWDSINAHPSLSALPRTDVGAMFVMSKTLGTQAACMVSKQINYDPTRGTNGSLTEAVGLTANGSGLEWGRTLTAGKRTDTAATNGTGVDDTAVSTAFGLQAYLQVFSFTGTNVTVKLQDSADNAAFADITGAAFATVTTAPGTQRIATLNTATVRRYVRAVTTTSGGFSSLVFAVAYNRNPLAGQVF